MTWNLAPLLLGALLGWTGATKAFGRSTREQAAKTVLTRVLGDVERATMALRGVGIAELTVAFGLIAIPIWWAPAIAAALLGCGFVAYLTYARVTAPDSSCGCTKNQAPITWRAFVRAGLVVVAAVAALGASTPWWSVVASSPLASTGLVLLGLAVVGALSTDLDHLWLLPVRRLRLRLLGHPLGALDDGRPPPIEATLELLDRSAAWEKLAPVVRSGLLEHWDDGGWRLLRFAGTYDGTQVSVVFALDVESTIGSTPDPAIRVTVVDDRTGTPLDLFIPVHP